MKNISASLAAHLAGTLTTLAELVKITRTDGTVVALTTHDAPIVFDGVTYVADGAYSPGPMNQAAKLGANDFDVTGVLGGAGIDAADLESGLFDHARIDVYLCNWTDLSQGVLHMRRGWLGEVVCRGGQYIAALRGLGDLLSRRVGQTYTPECRYDLGEARCGVALESLRVSGAVTGVTDRRRFSDTARSEENGAFACSKLTWTGGANSGASAEVKSWEDYAFTLWLPMPYAITSGDTYDVTPGCDKRFSTCRNRFNNGANYGGFPHLPGLGKILLYPDGK